MQVAKALETLCEIRADTEKRGVPSIYPFHPCHLLREVGGELGVLITIDGEGAEHVLRVFHVPSLAGVAVGRLRALALLILVMNRVGARRVHVHDFRSTTEPAFEPCANDGKVFSVRACRDRCR